MTVAKMPESFRIFGTRMGMRKISNHGGRRAGVATALNWHLEIGGGSKYQREF